MNYGVELFDDKGKNQIAQLVSQFVIDTILITGGGSRQYPLGPGESLYLFKTNGPYEQGTLALDNYYVSGNTVYWSVNNNWTTGKEILVVTKRIAQ